MSTITQPRDASLSRRPPHVGTPTSSARPSLDLIRSSESSPGPNNGSAVSLPNNASTSAQSLNSKRARAALREYYNLRKPLPAQAPGSGGAAAAVTTSAASDVASETSSIHDGNFYSAVPDSDLDRPDFDAEKFVATTLETQSLDGLLRMYHGALTDLRALDAERKALVYDNYSKLIAATEMISRLRKGVVADAQAPAAKPSLGAGVGLGIGTKGIEATSGPPDGGRWDDKVAEVMSRVEELRSELRIDANGRIELERRAAERIAVLNILNTPERIRLLLREGQSEQAREVWTPALQVLQTWKSRGVGGPDVQACIDEGEAAFAT